ncbi:hypothetical protein J6590_041071 [Homalodisca vitripennis]|nr:hypothetical protein J6590_041071 [Homalodisca vitripennis]
MGQDLEEFQPSVKGSRGFHSQGQQVSQGHIIQCDDDMLSWQPVLANCLAADKNLLTALSSQISELIKVISNVVTKYSIVVMNEAIDELKGNQKHLNNLRSELKIGTENGEEGLFIRYDSGVPTIIKEGEENGQL